MSEINSTAYALSAYHATLAAEATGYRRVAGEHAYAVILRWEEFTADQRADILAEAARQRESAERIDAQIAWERWFNGDPQVWRPAAPSWRN